MTDVAITKSANNNWIVTIYPHTPQQQVFTFSEMKLVLYLIEMLYAPKPECGKEN